MNRFTEFISSLIGLAINEELTITDAYESYDDLTVETEEFTTTVYENDIDWTDEESVVSDICDIVEEVASERSNDYYRGDLDDDC